MTTFGSVCSGIEAASVAFGPLGWKASWLSEIEPFPSSVLAHHYPDVPNLGDMTKLPEKIKSSQIPAPDIFCGGTPCQAFSVAGLRRSLDDARGNLSLTFCEIANEIDSIRLIHGKQPAVILWENVPGALNTKDNFFGCFLAGLAGEDDPLVAPGGKWANAGCVFGPTRTVAWRILDAQYFGVAQRRRRVFVVASARKGFDPCAVLFESDGVRRDSAPSREKGQVAPTIPARSLGGGGLGTDFDCDGGVITMAHGQGGAEIAENRSPTLTCNHEAPIAAYANVGHFGSMQRVDVSDPLRAKGGDTGNGGESLVAQVTHSLRGEGFDASEDGTGRGTPLVPVAALAFQERGRADGRSVETNGDLAYALTAPSGGGRAQERNVAISYAIQAGALRTNPNSGPDGVGVQADHAYTLEARAEVQVVCFAENSRAEIRLEGGDGQRTGALSTGGGKPGQGTPMVAVAVALRGREGGATAGLGDEVQNCLRASGGGGDKAHVLAMSTREVAQTITSNYGKQCDNSDTALGPNVAIQAMQVRRLTPVECEALQGFPKNYTMIPWRKKPADQCPDGPRYKALGNSWAVPNVRWIGQRIKAELAKTDAKAVS